jgi:hypothetical protein
MEWILPPKANLQRLGVRLEVTEAALNEYRDAASIARRSRKRALA